VLGVERVGVGEGFFDLGGDSILAMRVVSSAREAGWEVSARDVFRARTPEALAALARPVTTPHQPLRSPVDDEPLIDLDDDEFAALTREFGTEPVTPETHHTHIDQGEAR